MKSNGIYLSVEQQNYLKEFVRKGVHNSHEITRARVLLMLDRTGKTEPVRYKRIAEYAGISVQAVYNMRNDYLKKQDIESYLRRKKRQTPPRPPKLDGRQEAQILTLACSAPDEGRGRWTLELLTARSIELNIVEDISIMTVQRLLKKRNISLT